MCCVWTQVSVAAQGGQMEVLRWLREVAACAWHERTCFVAAAAGHLEVRPSSWHALGSSTSTRTRTRMPCWCWCWCKQRGAICGRGRGVQVLRWVREQGCPWHEQTCSAAAGARLGTPLSQWPQVVHSARHEKGSPRRTAHESRARAIQRFAICVLWNWLTPYDVMLIRGCCFALLLPSASLH